MLKGVSVLERLVKIGLGVGKIYATGGTSLTTAQDIIGVVKNGRGLMDDLTTADAQDLASQLIARAEGRIEALGGRPDFADGRLQDAKRHFEQAIPLCLPEPAWFVETRLNAAAIAEQMLTTAAKAGRTEGEEFPPYYESDNPETAYSRDFFLKVTTAVLTPVVDDPAFASSLQPDLWRGVFGQLDRMEAKQDLHADELHALPDEIERRIEAVLDRRAAQEAPIGLTLEAARNIFAHYPEERMPEEPGEIERVLVAKAQESATLRERLLELDNSADLVIRDLLAEARQQIDEGAFDAADDTLIKAEKHADETRARIRANRADLAKLRLEYRVAAGHYAAAATIVADDPASRWRFELQRASALSTVGLEFADNHALQEAIDLFIETVLPLAPRDERPQEWAKTQNDLGNALSTLGERAGDTDTLERAVQAYENAVLELTRDRVPLAWATTQNNLGTALCTLGKRAGDTDILQRAVEAYENALLEWTRDRVPLNWATTQNNLGITLKTLGERAGDTETLRRAVQAFESALLERTRDRVPLQWAMTQNNLGTALQTLGKRAGDTDILQRAFQAYENALLEWTRDRVPLNWATTQNNLGAALSTLGERAGDTDTLQRAVQAYESALLERTRDRVPLDWAMTTGNIAIVELVLFEAGAGAAHLARAEAAIEGAIEEFRRPGAEGYLAQAEGIAAEIRKAREGLDGG